ncbi:MAG: TraR/DksA C4-type zinc finger protein [Nitrospirae bacterium]|nr:TraR/DksA C4-type zinc finger protein [Nitrospirota bacterium]
MAMLSVGDIRKKLFAQRRDLFRQVAQTEDELLWLETDVESEAQERGQGERMVQLLDRLDERMKSEIEAIDRALVKLETGRFGRCEQCGKDIPHSRLEALPAAATCVVCAEAGEAQTALRK